MARHSKRAASTLAAALLVVLTVLTSCTDDSDSAGSDGGGNGPAPASGDVQGEEEQPEEEPPGDPVGGGAGTDPEAEAAYADILRTVEEFIAEEDLNGAGLVVVTEDEGIIHDQYWGDFDEERVSLIASSSKMLSAGILLRLADEGLLDMDTPVTEQLDWGFDSPITAAQLLSNSSGLVGLLPNPAYLPYVCQYTPSGQWDLTECGRSILATAEDDADVVPPDTEFRYGGAQWQVAGAVAEEVSGSSWAELVRETYVEPCGVDSLAYANHFGDLPNDDPFRYPAGFDGDPAVLTATDNPNIEGGAYSVATDYAELMLMVMRDGRCGDEQVLSPQAVEEMLADRIGATYGADASYAGTTYPGWGYGLGWWIERSTGRAEDSGIYGTMPVIGPDARWGAYLVVEATDTQGEALWYEIEPTLSGLLGSA